MKRSDWWWDEARRLGSLANLFTTTNDAYRWYRERAQMAERAAQEIQALEIQIERLTLVMK